MVVMENSQQTCAKGTPPRQGPEFLMRHNLMNCNVPIHCTLVVRNVVIVGCAEPWFTHAVAIGAILCPSITRAEALQTSQ